METDRYVVDAFSAEQLAKRFESYSAIEIRELLEGELVPHAMKLLAHYAKKDEPYHQLKQFSVRSGTGFYRSREHRRSAEEEYEHFLHYLTVKNEEHHARTGRWLTSSEREHITRDFYAPAYRAEMAKLSAETSRKGHGAAATGDRKNHHQEAA